MALQLEHELLSGVTGNYWKVDRITIDRYKKEIDVYLSLYLDAAARAADKKYIINREYKWLDEEFFLESEDLTETNYIEAIYTKIKAEDDFFATATDV